MIQMSEKAAAYLKKNPELFQAVQPFIGREQWSPENGLSKVEIIVDDTTVAVIDGDSPIKTIRDVPDDCDTYEIAFDEETVFFIVQDYLLINRIDPGKLLDYLPSET